MINRSLFLVLAVLLPLAGCEHMTVSNVSSAVEKGLAATGNDNEESRRLLNAGRQVAAALSPVTYESERTLGGGVAVKSLSTMGELVDDAELQRYVTLVGLAVSAKGSRPDVPFRFGVVNRDDINAWAAPGGYIFVTLGAVKAMQDEAQLAGVLGHEIAHVNQFHMINSLKRAQLLDGAWEATTSLTNKDLSLIKSTVNNGMNLLFTKGFEQRYEFEADELGVDMAAAAGYDPTGLLRYLQNLQGSAGASGGGWLASTHPPLDERIKRLSTLASTTYAGIEGSIAEGRLQQELPEPTE